MSSLERLPPDQRAVLALVLQRGRSYDEIANLLAIDRAAVRDRALAALDALGPSDPPVSPERRALITDYLLGQLPPRVSEDTREHLASTASERAWAQTLAGELAPLSSKPLPEIPAAPEPATAAEPATAPEFAAALEPEPIPAPEAIPEPEPTPESAADAEPAATPEPAAPRREPRRAGTPPREGTPPSSGRGLPPPVPAGQRASSRLGGGALLALALVIAIVVVIVILVNNNSSSPKKSGTTTPTTTPTTTTTGTGTTTGTSTTPHVIATIIMKPPSGPGKERGVAEIVTEGKVTGVIVAADHLAPNTTHNAYAVWLTSSGGASHLLGYVNPGVSKTGTLKTSGPLPSNVASYKEILITLETTTNTKTPGQTILEGAL